VDENKKQKMAKNVGIKDDKKTAVAKLVGVHYFLEQDFKSKRFLQ
jgi:hypothetical protein